MFPRGLSLRVMSEFGGAPVLCAAGRCGMKTGNFQRAWLYPQLPLEAPVGLGEPGDIPVGETFPAHIPPQTCGFRGSGAWPCCSSRTPAPHHVPTASEHQNTSLTKFLVLSSPSVFPINNKPSSALCSRHEVSPEQHPRPWMNSELRTSHISSCLGKVWRVSLFFPGLASRQGKGRAGDL